MYVIQQCFFCLPSDSTVSEDAGIETRTVATLALTARRSNHLARSHLRRTNALLVDKTNIIMFPDYGKFFTRTYLICAAFGAYPRRLLCTSTHARHDFLENGKRCPSSLRVIHCQKMATIKRYS